MIEPIIVLLNGPKHSGKTTAAKVLCSGRRGYFRGAFAQPLKEGTHASLDIDRPWDYWDEHEDKDLPNEEFFGLSPRQGYIEHSENYMKKIYGQDIYAKLMVRKIRELLRLEDVEIVFIADCGFQIEYEYLSDKFERVYVIRILRPGHTFEGDSREYIKNIASDRLQILDNNGDLGDFELASSAVLKHILHINAQSS